MSTEHNLFNGIADITAMLTGSQAVGQLNPLEEAYQRGRTEAYASYRNEIVRVMDCYQANLQRLVNKIEYLGENCTDAARHEFARLCREFDNANNN